MKTEYKYWVPFKTTQQELKDSFEFDSKSVNRRNQPKWSTSNRHYMEELTKMNLLEDKFWGSFGMSENTNKFIYIITNKWGADSWLKLGKCMTVKL